MSDTHVGRSTTRSGELFHEAAASLAGGVGSGTRSPRSGWLPVPVFVRSGEGAHLTDEDGNTFVDYVMGQGPLILGHRHPALIDAITETLRERGSLFSLAHDLEGEAAAAVSARMPSMELLRFGNSGTECVQYALRFARAFTGREKIVRFEGHYHGWSDAIHWSGHPGPNEWGSAAAPTPAPGSSGMPAAVAGTLIVAGWNDTAALERIFTRAGQRDRRGDHRADPRQLRRDHARARLPAADARADRSPRRRADLRRGADRVPGRPGRRPGAAGHPPRPDGARQGARRRGARRGGRRQARDRRDGHRRPHDARRHVQLEPARVRRGDRGRAGDRAPRASTTTSTHAAAGSPTGSCRPPGMPASRRAGAAPARSSSSGSPPTRRATTAARTRSSPHSPFATLHAELRERGILIQPPQEGLWLMSGAHSDADVDRTLEAAADAMPAVAAAAERGEVGPRGGVR